MGCFEPVWGWKHPASSPGDRFSLRRAMILETLHPMETSHVWSVFCFRQTKSFHDDGGCRAVAAPILPLTVDAGWGQHSCRGGISAKPRLPPRPKRAGEAGPGYLGNQPT